MECDIEICVFCQYCFYRGAERYVGAVPTVLWISRKTTRKVREKTIVCFSTIFVVCSISTHCSCVLLGVPFRTASLLSYEGHGDVISKRGAKLLLQSLYNGRKP
jgi:hypothetical protein